MNELVIEFSPKKQRLFSKSTANKPSNSLSRYREKIKFKPNLISLNKPDITAKPEGINLTPDTDMLSGSSTPLKTKNAENLTSLTSAIQNRSSSRHYRDAKVSFEKISALLSEACGMNEQTGKRKYPSGGGLYPIDIYLSLNHATAENNEMSAGNYRYISESNSVYKINETSIFTQPQFSQVFLPHAAGVIFLTFNLATVRPKYGDLGYKLALLEAGHIAQNLLLIMDTIGLNGIPLQFYYEDLVNDVLSLSGQEQSVCYAIEFGLKASKQKD